jgi:hypothetical protein
MYRHLKPNHSGSQQMVDLALYKLRWKAIEKKKKE